MEIPEVITLFETYGTGGALVVLVGVLLKYLIPALRSLRVNPSLGAHFETLQATLKNIESNTAFTQRRVEDIWERDAKSKKGK